ncbi:cation:proton antiporter [Halovulum sp. GXIMD14793]
MEPTVVFALIGVLGIGSQWLAWRLRMPAIVLMLAAGILAGPATGLINPTAEFGDLLRPIVSVAVAVILFEGGLTLNFAELRGVGPAVKRMVFLGAPLAWLLSTLAAHYGAGLSWESAVIFGGILIVTGPTVITPLLRQARLAPRPASILRWESIVNDPVGALAAVLAFEVITAIYGASTLAEAAKHLIIGITVASIAGYAGGKLIAASFKNGWVPEYMKVPVLFGAVLAVYASTDNVLHESGLLAVTIMGIVIANAHLPSLEELKRFKEHITIILVSGVFILLAASLDVELLAQLDWRAVLFVLLIIFVARPGAVLLSQIGTDLSWAERGIIAWIGPRGVVAVAVAGLFGTRLSELGVEDGAQLAPLAFVLVAATVVIHGFSLAPLARWWGLTSKEPPGVLMIGGSRFSTEMGERLKEAGLPVLIADRNWFRLRPAKQAGLNVFHGEILSEAAEHTLDLNRYGTLIAATDNDAYNTLVCTDFAPEFGRSNVFQIGRHREGEDERGVPVTLGGRKLGSGRNHEDILDKRAEGWRFAATGITEEYDLSAFRTDRPEAGIWALIRKSGTILFVREDDLPEIQPGDTILSFGPGRQPQPDA